jgi:hypothetical protein
MSLATVLDRWDKKYAWSLLGFALAVVFGAVLIYTEFIRERRPELRFERVSNTSVLDVRERLGNLEILYDGEDIQKAQKSLRVTPSLKLSAIMSNTISIFTWQLSLNFAATHANELSGSTKTSAKT